MGGGPLRIIPGGGPFIEGALPLPLPGPLPFTAPFIIGLGGGAEDNLIGGFIATGEATAWSFLCWFTMFRL